MSSVSLLQDAESKGCQYSVLMKAKPNRQQVENLLKTVQESYINDKLEPDDYLYVMEQLINEHDTSKIRQYVSYKLKKKSEKVQAQKQQLIKEQNNGLAQIEEQKMNAKMQEMIAAGEQKMQQILAQNKGALEVKMTEIQGMIEAIVRKELAKQS